jgi:hypothetical protein
MAIEISAFLFFKFGYTPNPSDPHIMISSSSVASGGNFSKAHQVLEPAMSLKRFQLMQDDS